MSAGERAVAGTGLVRGRAPDGQPRLVERTTGVPVTVLPELQALADRFGALPSPHLLPPRRVLADGARTVVELDAGPEPPPVSLASLVEARGHLSPGEVVTVGVALARALTAAHADDLLLGGLSSAQVLLRDDGMPVVAVGAQALLASAEEVDREGGRARDVGALAQVCAALLGPEPPPALADVLGRAAGADLAARPDAVVLGALLSRAVPPRPVERPPELHTETLVLEHRPGPALPARAVLVLVVLVVAAALAGWVSAPGGTPPSAAPAPRWPVVLDELDAARAAAFAAADEAGLARVYAPSAAALAADRARVRALAAAGHTAHGVRHGVRRVEVVDAAPGRVRLRVRDVLTPYEVRDRTGALVAAAPGRGEAVSLVALARTPDGWRVVEVRRPA